MKKIAIIGASGHGKVIADIAKLNGYEDIIFLDDNESLVDCNGYPVKGKSNIANNVAEKGYDVFVAIGNPEIRKCMQESIGFQKKIVTLIHPKANVAEDVIIGKGSVVMAGAIINPGTIVGKGCIINTAATVDHDNIISDYVHISVGAHLAGTVEVGEKTWVGVGAIVSNNIFICKNCIIGAGAVVVKNIEKKGTYVGIPAYKK